MKILQLEFDEMPGEKEIILPLLMKALENTKVKWEETKMRIYTIAYPLGLDNKTFLIDDFCFSEADTNEYEKFVESIMPIFGFEDKEEFKHNLLRDINNLEGDNLMF